MKSKALVGMLILCTSVATAQRGPRALKSDSTQERKCTPQMMAERQWNRVTHALVLDDKTTAKFEPIYKKYQSEKMALMSFPANCPKAKSERLAEKGKMTDADADKLINNRLERQAKMNDLEKRYYKEFQKAGLSPKQILRVYEAGKLPNKQLSNQAGKKNNEKGRNGKRQANQKGCSHTQHTCK